MKILVASPIDSGTIAKLENQHDVVWVFDAKNNVLRSLIEDRGIIGPFRTCVVQRLGGQDRSPPLHRRGGHMRGP